MSSLRILTMVVIFYQTTLCIIMGWLTLGCKLIPQTDELHEVTMMKLLYLYDPEACGEVCFYNYTVELPGETRFINNKESTMVWPVRNEAAAGFRHKLGIWLALHVLWTIFGAITVNHTHRTCTFYVILVPFTATGVSILVIDLVYTAIFLSDLGWTNTEDQILKYINGEKEDNLDWIKTDDYSEPPYNSPNIDEDTSWISLLFAYISCRGIVQWFINFWIIKDNYYKGLECYKRIQQEKPVGRKFISRRLS